MPMSREPRPQGRSFHAYCVGDAKSGTASLWGLLKTNFRSAHEPERAEILAKVVSLDNRLIPVAELDDFLLDRDARLNLEFDSSWANYFIMDRLVALFPEAKFVQLVRDCYTWVESVVNHLLTRTIPPDVQEFMDWWFEPAKFTYKKEDRTLEGLGLYSLECYLTRWRNQVEGPSRVIPQARLLTIPTFQIPGSMEQLARFLGVRPDQLDPTESHLNKGARKRPLVTLVDRAFIDDTVASVCEAPMARYFPEVNGVQDAIGLHVSA